MKPINTWVIHPFLVGLFPVLFLYAHNISDLPAQQIVEPAALILLATFLFVGIAKLLVGTFRKAGILISTFWLLFFTYQPLYLQLTSWFNKIDIKHSLLLFGFFLLVLLLGIYLRRKRATVTGATKVVNLSAVLLIFMPIAQIVPFQINKIRAEATAEKQERLNWQPTTVPQEKPDIVYIILDGLGRPDILKKNYDIDLAEFTFFLEREGFFLAPDSYANYSRTAVSLASSLNLNYINQLPGYHPKQTYLDLDKTVETANLLKWLTLENYHLYSFATSYENAQLTELANLITPFPTTPALENLLFYLTPLSILETNSYLYSKYQAFQTNVLGRRTANMARQHYEKILFALDKIPSYVGQKTPSFVFADLFIAHPPFVFTKDGNFQAPPANFTDPIADGNHFINLHPGGKQAYVTGYQDQVRFFIPKLKQLVKQIKQNATRPTVIILQADHGPGVNYHQEDITKTNFHERLGIFNAIYISDAPASAIFPEDLSPVNTFRYLLNHYYNTGFSILPNRYFFSPADNPADVQEIPNPALSQ